MVGQTHPVSKASGGGFARQWRMVKRRWGLYLLLSIPVIYVFIFNYIPVYGVTLAFKSYDTARASWIARGSASIRFSVSQPT